MPAGDMSHKFQLHEIHGTRRRTKRCSRAAAFDWNDLDRKKENCLLL